MLLTCERYTMTGFITTFSYMCTMCLPSLCHPGMCLSHSHSSPSSFMSSLVCCHYFLGVCEPMGCTRVAREACMGFVPAATPLGKMWMVPGTSRGWVGNPPGFQVSDDNRRLSRQKTCAGRYLGTIHHHLPFLFAQVLL